MQRACVCAQAKEAMEISRYRYVSLLVLICNAEIGSKERKLERMRTAIEFVALCSSCFRQREVSYSGRCSVRISCCVSQIAVFVKCIRGIVGVCGGVNEVVAIE